MARIVKLRCPHCEHEAFSAEDNICDVCGTEMREWTECQCCGEYAIPETECEDFCNKCKSIVAKKLYDFLCGLTEEEIAVLDDTVDDRFEWFMRDYKEKNNG